MKRRKFKAILSVLLCLSMLTGCMTMMAGPVAFAADRNTDVDNGQHEEGGGVDPVIPGPIGSIEPIDLVKPVTAKTCGDTLEWSVSEDGTVLTISGVGEMYDFYSLSNCEKIGNLKNPPWYFYTFIEKVIVENGVTSIGMNAFEYLGKCSLQEVEIASSVQSLGKYAFADCSSLTTVQIPVGVAEIPDGIFSGCTSLTNLQIPGTVQAIGEKAFAGCTALTSVSLPESVETLKKDAFRGCTNLEEIIIDQNMNSLDVGALMECDQLKHIYYRGTREEWKSIQFEGSINDYLSLPEVEYNYGGDEEAPVCAIISLSTFAATETLRLLVADNVGIRGAYFSKGETYSEADYLEIADEGEVVVTEPGTYYLYAVDTNGNVSAPQTVEVVAVNFETEFGTVVCSEMLLVEGVTVRGIPDAQYSEFSFKYWALSETEHIDSKSNVKIRPGMKFVAEWNLIIKRILAMQNFDRLKKIHPTLGQYTEMDEVKPEDFSVGMVLSNGAIKKLESGFDCSPKSFDFSGFFDEKQTITITYQNFTTTVEVDVLGSKVYGFENSEENFVTKKTYGFNYISNEDARKLSDYIDQYEEHHSTSLVNYLRSRPWESSSYGMALSAFLDYKNVVKVNERFYKKSLRELSSPADNMALMSEINFFEMLQYMNNISEGGMDFTAFGAMLAISEEKTKEILTSENPTFVSLGMSGEELWEYGIRGVIAEGFVNDESGGLFSRVYDPNNLNGTSYIRIEKGCLAAWYSPDGETEIGIECIRLIQDCSKVSVFDYDQGEEFSKLKPEHRYDFLEEKMDPDKNAFVDGPELFEKEVTLSEVVEVTRYIVGDLEEIQDVQAADVNADGAVNLKDVTLMKRYLAGGYDVELKNRT